MNDAVTAALESTHDEASFLHFVDVLLKERQEVDGQAVTLDGFQGAWANQTISEFLAAARAWASDSGFGARPGPKADNSWRQLAQFLYAGRSYE
jgi:hypothetical protein